MPNAIISLDYQKCNPANCDRGICVAIAACPLKLIGQEEPYDPPMTNTTLCKGCAKCATACPQKAITLV